MYMLMTFPGRRSLAITTFISTTLIIVALLFTNAHNSPLDELGCHRDPPNARYHCHTGQLKGKEFATKDEAQRALASVSVAEDSDFKVSMEDTPEAAAAKAEAKERDNSFLPPPPEVETAVVNHNLLKIISWNVKKRATVDYDRIVNILSEADIAVLQDLDLDEKGKGPLHIIGDLLQSRINSKICRMWFKNSAQGRERHGILWRQSTIGYVNESGEIKDKCGEMAVVVPTNRAKGASLVASNLFFSKVQKKMFQLGSVQLESRPSHPKRDVPNLFKPLDNSNWPTIVVGDVRYNTNDLKKWNFKTNIAGTNVTSRKGRASKSTSYNVWTKNAVVVRALHINLYDRFSEISPKEIESSLSHAFPMLAEVALVPEADDQLTTMMKRSKKEETKAAAQSPAVAAPATKVIVEAAAKDRFEEPSEDIEAEANLIDGGEKARTPAAATKAGKKSSKKKKR